MPLDERTVVIGQDVLPKMRTCWGSQAHVRASFRNFCSALHAPSHDVLSEPQETANDETIQSVVFSYPAAFTASVTLTEDSASYAHVSYILPKIDTEEDFDPLPPGGGMSCGMPFERHTFVWPSNANYQVQNPHDDWSNGDTLAGRYLNASFTVPNACDDLTEFSDFAELMVMLHTSEANNATALLLRECLGDQPLLAEELVETIDLLIAKIDEKLSEQMNEILHNDEFQQLESAWRGLAYTVKNSGEGVSLRVKVLNISKAELSDMVGCYPGAMWDKSPLCNIICKEGLGTFGNTPFDCLVGDYDFSYSPPDVSLLNWVGTIAEASRAPFISGVAPDLLGPDSWDEVPVLTGVAKLSPSALSDPYSTIGGVGTSGMLKFASGGTIRNAVFDSRIENREILSRLLDLEEPVTDGSADVLEAKTKYNVWEGLRIFGDDPDMLRKLSNYLSPVQAVSKGLFVDSGFAQPSSDIDGSICYNGDGINVLCGGLNNDKFTDGEGDDPLRGDLGTDRICGGSGKDRSCGHSGNDDQLFDRFSFDTVARPNKYLRRRIIQLEARQDKIKALLVTIRGKVSSAGTKLLRRHFAALEVYLLGCLHGISSRINCLGSVLPRFYVEVKSYNIRRHKTWISESDQIRTYAMQSYALEYAINDGCHFQSARSDLEPPFHQRSKSMRSKMSLERTALAKIRSLGKLDAWKSLLLPCLGNDNFFKQRSRIDINLEDICHAFFKERAMPA